MFKKIVLIVIVLAGLAAFLGYDKIDLYLAGRTKTTNMLEQYFYLDKSVNSETLADMLFENDLISNKKALVKVANYKKLDEGRIAAGKYTIVPKTTYRQLLNGFTLNSNGNGNAEVEVEVTFNNCRDIYQMSGSISKNLALDSAELIALLESDETLKKYQFTLQELPALFLPNTYKMYYDTGKEQFVERMAKEFKTFWNSERKEKMIEIGFSTPAEVVTLASIVYSEQSRHTDEWPIIAALYLNRIHRGIRLQSDPTFKFCWGDKLAKVQRLLKIHRDIVCDYNTYQIDGLPPGPICIPPSGVIDAVLSPDNNRYIYMCAKPDYTGRHNFAVSGYEHARNARIFQNWLGKELKNKPH